MFGAVSFGVVCHDVRACLVPEDVLLQLRRLLRVVHYRHRHLQVGVEQEEEEEQEQEEEEEK